jgi:hypothetical protein
MGLSVDMHGYDVAARSSIVIVMAVEKFQKEAPPASYYYRCVMQALNLIVR